MHKKPSLKKAMTPFPYSIDLEASVAEARQLMADHDVHHLPVCSGSELVGMLTARDIASLQVKAEALQLLVKNCYAPDPYVVELDAPLDEVIEEMAERHIGSAIVMRHGRLAGVITHVDICRSYADFLREVFPPPGDDLVA